MGLHRFSPTITLTYEDQEDVVFELEVITDVELLDEPENTRVFSDEYKLVEDGIPEGEETDELMEEQSELLGQLWEDDSHWSHAIEQWFLSDEEFAVLGFVISPARDKLIRERKVRQLFPQGDGSESEIRLIELKGDYNHLKMWDRSKYETGLGGILQMKQGVRIPNLVEAYEYSEGVNQKIKLNDKHRSTGPQSPQRRRRLPRRSLPEKKITNPKHQAFTQKNQPHQNQKYINQTAQ